MTYTDNFRISMRGFNRTDVVQFLQHLTAEHEKALRALQDENTRLTGSLEALQVDLQAVLAEKSALEEQLHAASNAPAAEPREETPTSEAPTADTDKKTVNELELAAYRRAEMAERLARERAAAADEHLRTLFAQLRERLAITTGDFSTVLDAFETNFEQLRQVIHSAQLTLADSDTGVKAVEHIFTDL